jgi:serine/threonine protein kinase
VWKVADFGLTCEATSTALLFTEFSHGTPGYRAPEMLEDDNSNFNNKVDIWAMGCILFELATGEKPFATDHVVAEYSRGDWELEEHCHPNIGPEVAKAISDAIHGMFQIRPSLRPRSTALAISFDKHYQSAKEHTQVQLLEKSQGSAPLGTLMSSTAPNGAKHSEIN